MGDDIEEIRKRKMAQLQNQISQQQEEQVLEQKYEEQKDQALRQILLPAAKSRLTTLKLANPQLATQVEQLVVYVYQQTGKKISDGQLKAILEKIRGKKKEITIIRK